ncbi:heavy metal translocating P-type ATPase [Cocleimonas sp. KMM 6892]|uniref:heavy metal translocating P-type ATPase n=1 Tax=unclassified Cocleimonas TaxID=2639732 RepID=UPI002DBD4F08|nr:MULTISPECIES: heavy metal translocating P-type ATPase [unclassified Cocleimonas]MEB8432138.1 heavy metal translocating P-type ATPase [Cocleimonas sp. KMM 6892]MEC4714776.1 heavy metal translocating P-type ATPase [Cocleimonas sp. KMM 6895]MEC4744410.1 heavy metal translocating P-type ATPase [Cocleimonas sp. KMM 6896]
MSQDCFHCGLPVPNGSSYYVVIDDKQQPMCCTGCKAVAEAIVENGLTDFYKHRTTNSKKAEDLIPEELVVYDNESLQKSFVHSEDGTIREASLVLEGIVCAACVWLNEKHVLALPGVIEFRINYSTSRASLKWNNDQIKLSDVLQAIVDIGYSAHPFDPGRMETLQKKEKSIALRRIALAGMGMMQVMMPAIAIYIGEDTDMSESMLHFLRWISLIITTPVVFYSSRVFFTSAWRDLKRRHFGMDVPVSIAIGSAYLASIWATVTNTGEVYFDSVVMFTFFLLLGRFFEMGVRHKAGQVADALVRLVPQTATRLEKDEQGNEIQNVIAANELSLDDRVIIKPGETIPADGKVVEGSSSVNESLLTGENMPLQKQIGDELIGGTLNVESPLTMQVMKLGDSTMLSSIIRLLDRAQSEKPNLAKFADKGAAWFVLALLAVALVVFIAWWFIDPSRAFWVALSVLVITCPCALSLATPAALTATTGNLTQKGVLTTRGHALETLSKVTHVIFDKTGTLTHGRHQLLGIDVLGESNETRCKQLAAGLEVASEHPLAKALSEISSSHQVFENLSAVSGKGVVGFHQGEEYRLGSYHYVSQLAKHDLQDSKLDNVIDTPISTVYLGKQGHWLTAFHLQDEVREESKSAIQSLLQAGIDVSLLSGDNEAAVKSVAETLGIKNYQAKLLPADKLNHVQALQAKGEVIAMVGDGVNDAPVLATANVSIAMGKGSQLAQASADMILLSEDLNQIPASISLSKRMQTVIHQNFSWAIIYNVIAVPIAAMGFITPWMAAIGMSMSSLLVVLNALRLK